MAKDKSKKGFRKTPEEWVKFLIDQYGYEVAAQYVKDTGRGKAHASKQRIDLSEAFEKVGSVHEGHFAAAKDQDLKRQFGGGPTTGRGMRPEYGFLNVAHGEAPRIPVPDMERLGFPTNWISDFYEWDLERLGMKVIGNLDVQGAMDVDAGMPIEQAEAQSRLRDDLRRQGVDIPGARPTYPEPEGKPLKYQLPETQVIPPVFDATDIKQTGEVKVRPRTGRVPKVPATPAPLSTDIKIKGGAVRTFTRILPGQLDDIILGGTVSAAVGGATLLGGGTPAQAAEAAGATFVDIATDPGGMQGSGAGERFYPDGMERQSPEGLARAQREREEAFQKSVVQPFNQIMNFVGGVVKMIPSGVGF